MEERINELYRLVKDFCRRYNIYDEDMVQELVWAVYQYLPNFDESRGRFSTFVYMYCRTYYFDKKSKKRLEYQSLDVVSENKDRLSEDRLSLLDSVSDTSILGNTYLTYVYDKLSPMLRDYLEGMKRKDIAKKYNMLYITCVKKIETELKKLREAYGK